MVGKFRLWVEGKGGWKVFWEGKPGEGEVVPESKMQILFLGVLDEHFKMAGLRLDREVETAAGRWTLPSPGTGASVCSLR